MRAPLANGAVPRLASRYSKAIGLVHAPPESVHLDAQSRWRSEFKKEAADARARWPFATDEMKR